MDQTTRENPSWWNAGARKSWFGPALLTLLILLAVGTAAFIARFAFPTGMRCYGAVLISLLLATVVCGLDSVLRWMRCASYRLTDRFVAAAPMLALCIGLVTTAGGSYAWYTFHQQLARTEFELEANRLTHELVRRLNLYEYGLRGARGLFAASERVTAASFRDYSESRDYRREFPGSLGYGFIERVPRSQLEAFVAERTAEAADGFAVKTSGNAEDLYVIRYVEPLDRNRPALGYDIGSDEVRRKTADLAMTTGRATLTPPITLMQDQRKKRGFLFLLPLYRRGAPLDDEAARRAACLGWVYTPLVIDDTLSGVTESVNERLDVELFIGEREDYHALVFDADEHLRKFQEGTTAQPFHQADMYANRSHLRQQIVEVGGQEMLLVISARPAFNSSQVRYAHWVVLLVGAMFSVAGAVATSSMVTSRSRALELARQITKNLELSEQQARESQCRAENALTSLESHKLALDQHAIVAVTDIKGRIKYVNDKFCEISQYAREELIGQTHKIVNSGHHPRGFWREMWGVITSGKTWHGEVCNRAKDGSLYWVDTTIVPFFSRTGQLHEFVAIRAEITQRKRAETELAEARSRLQSVLDSATEVSVIATDRAGLITLFSKGAERMLGYTAAAMVGRRNIIELHEAAEVERRANELSTSLQRPIHGFETLVTEVSQGTATRGEWTYRCACGSRKLVDLSLTPFRDGTGEVIGYLGTAVDVTERIRTETMLRAYARQLELSRTTLESQAETLTSQAQELKATSLKAAAAAEAKSAFLANMSHEIRTPLTAIIGYADLLREEPEMEEDRRVQCLDTICRAGQHLLAIINDVLDLSKIEAGKLAIDHVEADLPLLLQGVGELLRPRAQEKGVALEVRFDSPLPRRFLGDPTRLRQILMNLAGNAVKFTREGRIAILASMHDMNGSPWLRVDVQDTGAGLSDEQAAQLFQPFLQADSSVTRQHGGTGLGLSISRRLAELMQGRLTLLTTKFSVGSTFRLELPLQIQAEPSALQSPVLPSVGAGVRLRGRILFAEDGLDNQRLIGLLLRRTGAEVDIADNGRIALEMLTSGGSDYDLLLTDMQMPEMDGYTLARTLREQGRDLPIIAITAHAMSEDREKCLAAGCDDFITKPIERRSMLATISKWMPVEALAD